MNNKNTYYQINKKLKEQAQSNNPEKGGKKKY